MEDRLVICNKVDKCKNRHGCEHYKPHLPYNEDWDHSKGRDLTCDELEVECNLGMVICVPAHEYNMKKEMKEYLDGIFDKIF